MTLAWSAALIAQAGLAMRLPLGSLRQFHAWQTVAGVALFAIRQADGPYSWFLAAFWIVDAAMLLRAVPFGTPCPWLGLSSLSAAATIAWGRDITAYVLLASLPHVATALALVFARGWMLAFLSLRWLMLMAGWWSGLSAPLWIAHQWIQAALFVAWAWSPRPESNRRPPHYE